MKKKYVDINFREDTLTIIQTAIKVFEDYAARGLDLTLRQLYYRFVAKKLWDRPNTKQSYKRLGEIITDARLAGLVDWNHIIDRTRTLKGLQHWNSPQQLLRNSAAGYLEDKWADQPFRVEVWIEKDALVGVIAGPCSEWEVDYFSCRGYTSQSSMWRAAQRLRRYEKKDQETIILHLGDHDPSGVDMTRDIQERLDLFGANVTVERIALTMDQVNQYQPPPDPAKVTDARATKYIAQFGHDSWELDALEPEVIVQLIHDNVAMYRDDPLWEKAEDVERTNRMKLYAVADQFDSEEE
jgi:hypothetical protein